MTSFVTAYLIVWAFVAWYVLRLRAGQRRISARLQALEGPMTEHDSQGEQWRAA